MDGKSRGTKPPEGAERGELSGPSEAGKAIPETGSQPKEKKSKSSVNRMMKQGTRISDRIILCQDGTYRWEYELSLLKNPTIFFLIWKIFFFIILGIFAVITIADMVQWGADRLVGDLKFLAYFLVGMTVLAALGYGLYAAVMGGKYCVLFEMDEQGVNHKQIPGQAKKARTISALTVLSGLASRNVTTVGVGMNAARTEMYSSFSSVRKVKAYPRRNLIKVNGLLSRNQVYAHQEDFAFVLDYITARCVNARKPT